jgi:Ca2+-binding RTX toxin-like protein
MVHIRKKNSVHVATGDAFPGTGSPAPGPDTLIVDKDAFLISDDNGNGANLAGSWTINIKGRVASLGPAGSGLQVQANNTADSSTLTIGVNGKLGGGSALAFLSAGTVVNRGHIDGPIDGAVLDTAFGDITFYNLGRVRALSGIAVGSAIFAKGPGTVTLNNGGVIDVIDSSSRAFEAELSTVLVINTWGTMKGGLLLGSGADIFTNFHKVGKVTKHGVVTGLIDLGAGEDQFNGGKHAENVRGGVGNDTINLGGGNDIYSTILNDDDDTLNGGSGVDTYDLRSLVPFTVNLDAIDHNGFALQTSLGGAVHTSVVGFENVFAGSAADILYGSAARNVIKGAIGADHIYGFGGRDTLSGGEDNDVFHFTALKDSGVASSKRDVITDFVSGSDKIVLEEIDANSKTPGVEDAFSPTGNGGFGKFTHTPGQLRFQYDHGNTIVG